MNITYDTPIEVSEKQYNAITRHLSGIVAHRKDGHGKFWIKPGSNVMRRFFKNI